LRCWNLIRHLFLRKLIWHDMDRRYYTNHWYLVSPRPGLFEIAQDFPLGSITRRFKAIVSIG
jgi:hypothetical protein